MKIDMQALEADVWKYMKTYARTFAKEASYAAVGYAKEAVDQFYNNYTPLSYRRTYNLQRGSYASKRYYHENGNRIYGGVRISSEKMKPYIKYEHGKKVEIDPAPVMRAAWREGEHGYRFHAQTDRPTPVDIVKDKLEHGRPGFEAKAEAAAVAQHYTVLNFTKR